MIDKPKTFRQAVKDSILEMPVGTKFHGYELESIVKRRWTKHPRAYTETILRTARLVARDNFKCIDIKKSLYERI